MVSRLVAVFILILSLTSCHVPRYFIWNFADVRDYKKFQSVPIPSGSEKTEIPLSKGIINFRLTEKQKEKGFTSFEDFLESNKTNVFIVLHGDSLIYEKFFRNYSDSSVYPSFSVSKAVVSALTGIAISEGKIKSLDEPIGQYLPWFNGKEIGKVTVGNLLNMRSGIAFRETYGSPFSSMAKYYYGRNLRKYIENLDLSSQPDSAYEYLSVNTLLLGLVIEKASGMKLNEYLSEKIWKPAGMNYTATWSVDSRKHKTIKSFCCLNARPVDYVIFGKLYMQQGNINGKQLIPAEWVKNSTRRINNSIDSQGFSYTSAWRVFPDGAFFAKGVLGQYIWVNPAKKIVIVRLGKGYGGVNWVNVFRQVEKQKF